MAEITEIDSTVVPNSTEEDGEYNPQEDTSSYYFYQKKFPEVDEIVMCKIDRLTDYCAFVSLLEYNNREATIQFSEISRGRLRTQPHKILKIGSLEPLAVIKVDEEKGYIDVTKKTVTKEEKDECTQRFNKSKTVHSIVKHIGETLHISIESLYENVVYPLMHSDKFAHPIDAFQMAVINETVFDELKLTPELKQALLKEIQHRLGFHPIKIQSTIELTCFTSEGISAIIHALNAGLSHSEKDPKLKDALKITVDSAPLYNVTLTVPANSKEAGFSLMNEVIGSIKSDILQHHGSLKVRTDPSILSA